MKNPYYYEAIIGEKLLKNHDEAIIVKFDEEETEFGDEEKTEETKTV